MRSHRLAGITLAALALSPLAHANGSSAAFGLLVEPNQFASTAYVFDTESDTILHTVPLPGLFDPCGGDAVIGAEGVAAISTGRGQLVLLDLMSDPPAVLGTVFIQADGLDIDVTPNGRFVVAIGTANDVVSVVDLTLGTEVEAFSLNRAGATSIAAAANDTVLVGFNIEVIRLALDPAGALSSSSGKVQSLFIADNLITSPDGTAGVLSGNLLFLFRYGPMQLGNVVSTTPQTCSTTGAFSASARRIFLRSYACNPFLPALGGFLEGRSYNPSNAQASTTADWVVPVADLTVYCPGRDEIAIHPRGDKIYVPETNGVAVLSSADGSRLGAIQGAGTSTPVVALRANAVTDRRRAARLPNGTQPTPVR